MPNAGLSSDEAAHVVAYLEAASAAAPPAPAAAPALPAGDPQLGKDLFTGTVGLRNGGAPCMGCHSIAGIGALGGGALGPDLTATAETYGDAGLASVLAAFPFPTMQPLFSARPLTPEEQAALRAFLEGAPLRARPSQALVRLALLAFATGAAALALAHLVWRRRLRDVRRPLVARAYPAAGRLLPEARPVGRRR